MYSQVNILSWLECNVQSMRKSGRKTLAAIVVSGLLMKGIGVLALGRIVEMNTHTLNDRYGFDFNFEAGNG